MYGPFVSLPHIFIFIIVLIIVVNVFKIAKIKAAEKANRNTDYNDNYIDYDLRLKKLEERIANLETIVLERERDKKFSAL